METKREQLEEQLKRAQARLDQAMKEQGEACGENCDWHDNNAYDLATSLTDTYQALVDSIEKQIKELKEHK
ncbi:TPA: hypothetical protein DIU27_03410 [Candidatus Collierbacteria bacterium]|uniref:Transcription elongation factor GreA/GreB N-terminal domain-containing protein n=1 Tax=Candidatus Collierbacteria bacterium GW2011_GWB2_44_22 TaxID=1618387 RepID=A0A0G1HYK8_9BACT|nr:MAG: hypothetical protein UW31_C0007G0004 [Candidatus Collierbacteria bacterium GW2011_GWA2_44_13]KKT50012.1 MAG: hypothetical protein UW42_C0026G0007 [Candidatus Collierbacteria bacterium GW2011_GWB1_44_197]KKT52236.1 MAG: hypothetical protein UW44_C0003G0079 [Candidatus Collierbacteria bacterium GW2011_GWB2_44_22]KKT62400.1 MAG: hypothetical protein UW56_C0007G0008 [Candidatus Collierbacteria bacterium GW2011_GWD1_44_27]KKT66822.1 MAG: hypothetical protein UW58_C0002G0007 [Candidatus Colli